MAPAESGNGAGPEGSDPARAAKTTAGREVRKAAARKVMRRMQPEPGEETADPEDLVVTRDPESGAVEPVKRKTPYNELVVRFRPLLYRDQRKYGLDDRGLLELNEDERLEFLREHVVEPDLSGLESLDDLRFSVVEDLLVVIAAHSRDKRWAEMPRPVEDDGDPGKV